MKLEQIPCVTFDVSLVCLNRSCVFQSDAKGRALESVEGQVVFMQRCRTEVDAVDAEQAADI
jgi:hypothetical protein